MRACFLAVGMLFLAGCTVESVPMTRAPEVDLPAVALVAERKARNFIRVAARIEPVAERACREARPGAPCDFLIAVDDTPGAPPNAFQTLDDQGNPILAFTISLIAISDNADELAFIMAHEAAHHILGHLERQRQNASAGAAVLGGLARAVGAGGEAVRTAQDVGAEVGARQFSKEFELEADTLGAKITRRAGFDPVRGAQFFLRVPDPGNRFLGTHPPNKARIEAVRRASGL